MATHSSILAGKSHGQRSLVGYSPWGRKQTDTAEATEHAAHAGHEKLHVLSDPQKPQFLWQDIKWHLKD